MGLGHTLKALNSNRLWQLIYSEGFSALGFECSKCSALFALEEEACSFCGAAIRPVANVVERAVDHALRKGAKIEVVTGEASAELASAGGIGGFLRARTGTAQL